jgi:hypothetical protein
MASLAAACLLYNACLNNQSGAAKHPCLLLHLLLLHLLLQIETFLQDEGHKQQREPAVETLKDEELFVLDKVRACWQQQQQQQQ